MGSVNGPILSPNKVIINNSEMTPNIFGKMSFLKINNDDTTLVDMGPDVNTGILVPTTDPIVCFRTPISGPVLIETNDDYCIRVLFLYKYDENGNLRLVNWDPSFWTNKTTYYIIESYKNICVNLTFCRKDYPEPVVKEDVLKRVVFFNKIDYPYPIILNNYFEPVTLNDAVDIYNQNVPVLSQYSDRKIGQSFVFRNIDEQNEYGFSPVNLAINYFGNGNDRGVMNWSIFKPFDQVKKLVDEQIRIVNERIDNIIPSKQHIKILFIGNSLTLNATQHLPLLMYNLYGNEITYEIFNAYIGSYTVKAWVQNVCEGTTKIGTFRKADNTTSEWTNYNGVYNLQTAFENFGPFDVVSFQPYFNHTGTEGGAYVEDISYFKPFISYLKSYQTSPFMLCYLMHHAYTVPQSADDHGHTEDEVWQRNLNGIDYCIKNTQLALVFPCGAINRLAMQNGIPQTELTSDNYHNKNGFPNILLSYGILVQLEKYLGISDKINNKLYYEENPSDTLKSYYNIAQECALRSGHFSDYITQQYSIIS